ncbi:hypothetical protein GXP74_20870 [Streptacidiphilus sp. P02-A3a]|nr:hypothetical protein GXP74_20505 [Streptacidiphilus sp. P02-A3a]QMU70300.1 hypothetical protein GXP74_20870 [Streptacidiphilus sp. P02-A3a]
MIPGYGAPCAEHPGYSRCRSPHARAAAVCAELSGRDEGRPVDRALVERLLRADPTLRQSAQLRYEFGRQAVVDAALGGIRQYVDLGCGYPPPRRPRRSASALTGMVRRVTDTPGWWPRVCSEPHRLATRSAEDWFLWFWLACARDRVPHSIQPEGAAFRVARLWCPDSPDGGVGAVHGLRCACSGAVVLARAARSYLVSMCLLHGQPDVRRDRTGTRRHAAADAGEPSTHSLE